MSTGGRTADALSAVALAMLVLVLILLAVLVGATACTPCTPRPEPRIDRTGRMYSDEVERKTEPVDAVVLWVRTGDAWMHARNIAAKNVSDSSLASNSNNYDPARLTVHTAQARRHKTNKDEAYFTIVAAARNMPWLRQILLVTQDGQVPDWFDDVCTMASPMPVRLVHHSEYIPASVLPTFSSDAIEAHLHLLERLADRFVLFSDDMFILKPVDQHYFFDENGNAIVRGCTAWQESQLCALATLVFYQISAVFDAYSRSVVNMARSVQERTGSTMPLIEYHHPRSCSKTMLSRAVLELGQGAESPYAITLRAPLRAKRGCPAIWAVRTLALINGDAHLPARDSTRWSAHFVLGKSNAAHAHALSVLRRKVSDKDIPTFLCVNGVPGQAEDKMAEYLDALAVGVGQNV